MIVGVEGIHTWHTGLALNNRSGFPRIWLRRCELHQSADFDPLADAIPGKPGEVPRYGDRTGKAVVYEGDLQARTLPALRNLTGDFLAAFSRTDEGRMDAAPHAGAVGLAARYFFARPLDASVPDEQTVSSNRTDFGYSRPFTLALRMGDPRFYNPATVTAQDTTLSAMGGTGIPFNPGSSVSASGQGLEVVAANSGNADTDALIAIRGPARNPVISNETSGVFLRFRDLVLDTGEDVTIDFKRRRAERTNGTSVWHKLDPASTWTDRGVPCLSPGNNTIRFRAYDIASGARLLVTFDPADYS